MSAGIATAAMIALKPIDEVTLHVSRPLVLPGVRLADPHVTALQWRRGIQVFAILAMQEGIQDRAYRIYWNEGQKRTDRFAQVLQHFAPLSTAEELEAADRSGTT